MNRTIIVAAALSLAACASAPPQLQTSVETVEVRTPVRAPCPEPADVPIVPRRVAEEVPAMPRFPTGTVDWEGVSRILGAKVLELFGYADRAAALLRECSAP